MSDLKISAGHELGQVVCKALGLDASKITSMSIHIEPNKPAVVEIAQLIEQGQGEQFGNDLARYRLVPIEG